MMPATSVGRMVKESIVEDLSKQLNEKSNVFIASVNRLSAPDADLLRRKLSTTQARMVMIKRRLSKRALDGLKMSGIEAMFEGSVGIVLPGDDVLPTAKTLIDFVKEHAEQMSVKGGVVDGQLLDAERVKYLADLPPKPVLLAQVLGMIEAPISDVIFTIERLIGDLGWVVEQAAASKPAAPAAPAPAAEAPKAEAAPQPPTTEPTTQEGQGI
jgi:large subunit ribosomal protein L10